jgi:hypothetical protein
MLKESSCCNQYYVSGLNALSRESAVLLYALAPVKEKDK